MKGRAALRAMRGQYDVVESLIAKAAPRTPKNRNLTRCLLPRPVRARPCSLSQLGAGLPVFPRGRRRAANFSEGDEA